MSADTGVHLLYDLNKKMGVCSTSDPFGCAGNNGNFAF